ncbi:hypothetical protein AB1Y20_008826 [Prymnesium parvum]|uniref:RGS domain-containing protein n=1 Tax=Prymnesium parvum TaxID=97485 RepID=A0AB34IRM5_PRYPA
MPWSARRRRAPGPASPLFFSQPLEAQPRVHDGFSSVPTLLAALYHSLRASAPLAAPLTPAALSSAFSPSPPAPGEDAAVLRLASGAPPHAVCAALPPLLLLRLLARFLAALPRPLWPPPSPRLAALEAALLSASPPPLDALAPRLSAACAGGVRYDALCYTLDLLLLAAAPLCSPHARHALPRLAAPLLHRLAPPLAAEALLRALLAARAAAAAGEARSSRLLRRSAAPCDERASMKLAGAAASLAELLRDGGGRAAFLDFLRRERAEESLRFYLAVHRFRREQTDELPRAAEAIAREFLEVDAESEINIPGRMREQTLALVRSGSPPRDVFDAPCDEVFDLMAKDPFRRFVQSDLFDALLAPPSPPPAASPPPRQQRGSLPRLHSFLPRKLLPRRAPPPPADDSAPPALPPRSLSLRHAVRKASTRLRSLSVARLGAVGEEASPRASSADHAAALRKPRSEKEPRCRGGRSHSPPPHSSGKHADLVTTPECGLVVRRI